jgi:hypothetical protein
MIVSKPKHLGCDAAKRRIGCKFSSSGARFRIINALPVKPGPWRLSKAPAEQRQNFEILGSGQGIHWPELDEDIRAEGMLFGIPSRRRHLLEV